MIINITLLNILEPGKLKTALGSTGCMQPNFGNNRSGQPTWRKRSSNKAGVVNMNHRLKIQQVQVNNTFKPWKQERLLFYLNDRKVLLSVLCNLGIDFMEKLGNERFRPVSF